MLKFILQEARSGVTPSFFDVYVEGHKGDDPANPEVLCDEIATQRMVRINKYNYGMHLLLSMQLMLKLMFYRLVMLRK